MFAGTLTYPVDHLNGAGQGQYIRKRRYIVPREGGRHWEIDVFEDDNEGLCIAEVELQDDAEGKIEIERPEWLGREVTGDSAYYNASLARDGC